MDETGEPEKRNIFSPGSTSYFGLAAISIADRDYEALRLLLAQIHWLRGTATTIDSTNHIWAFNFLRGLKELEAIGLISASALYIDKKDYKGRYLTWSDYNIHKDEWRYYLRNYLLRHLLEYHFNSCIPNESVELIIDRIPLTESQLENTRNYLNSQTLPKESVPFAIPYIQHLTLPASEYVGGLEVAHLLADVLKRRIQNNIPPLMEELSRFVRTKHFLGEEKVT
ncbi:hypothetical protein ES708_00788 [subsurface metagenome]